MKKLILGLLVVLLMFVSVKTPVSANSALTQWSGTDSTGIIITDQESPIIVEKELLTFDVQEFPLSYYEDEKEFLDYSGKVSAEYTFYNPADYAVSATLAFPFGSLADYAKIYDYRNNETSMISDTDKYDITVNGTAIEKQLRHTLMPSDEQFELEKDIIKLHDGYITDSFYKPELLVTKYTYLAKNVDKEKHEAADAGLLITDDNLNAKIYMENQSGGQRRNNGFLMTTWVDLEKEFSVYVIGEPLKLNWTFYHNGENNQRIEGTMELISIETLTFKDFALSKYDSKSGILDYDWYNAFVSLLKENEWLYGVINSVNINLDVSNMLMRWYQYDITLEPKQTLVNTVTAPIYPSINNNQKPSTYEYKYLLSPAKTWKEFGNLDVIINTPYNLIENSLEGFKYNDSRYELHLTGLPEGELTFMLSDNNENMLNDYLVSCVNSSFKIGHSNNNMQFHDLVIDYGIEKNEVERLKIMYKYLLMLSGNKNEK